MQRLEAERMFVAVMETGNFARAAERLKTSSGQASKLVSRLEEDLGVRLLNRTTRAISPTEVGQAYFERIRAVIEDLDQLEEAVRNRSGNPTGRLKLTAPQSFGSGQLAPVLIAFARAYPGISLDVSLSDRLVNLVDEGFDAAVRIGLPRDENLMARRLCESRVVTIAAPGYIARRGAPQRPFELSGHDCIIDSNAREPEVWRFHEGGGAITVPVNGRIHFSSPEACVTAAVAELGVAQVPSFVAGQQIRAGAVELLLEAHEFGPIPVQAMYPPGRHLALKVRVLIDFLVERFRGQPDWEKGW
jgi:DNA-binding transcriptional LysR family regulator